MKLAAEIALTHHERWDGAGYPQGLKAEQIPLAGRIAAVADVFDALTSVRSYKWAWSMTIAYDYLAEKCRRTVRSQTAWRPSRRGARKWKP